MEAPSRWLNFVSQPKKGAGMNNNTQNFSFFDFFKRAKLQFFLVFEEQMMALPWGRMPWTGAGEGLANNGSPVNGRPHTTQ